MAWSYIDWAERAGLDNLRGRLATGDMLHANAMQLLQLLLAGMGAALGFGARVFASGAGPVEWGAAFVAAWLAAVAAVLTLKCVATRPTQVLSNEPAHLYQPELNLSELELRGFELQNIQQRIDLTKARNRLVAAWLDWCRYAACATPLVFALGAAAGM